MHSETQSMQVEQHKNRRKPWQEVARLTREWRHKPDTTKQRRNAMCVAPLMGSHVQIASKYIIILKTCSEIQFQNGTCF